MQNDLISRSALLEKAIGVVVYDEGGWDCNVRAVPDDVIEKAPTIEAEPVRHGRWVDHMCRDWRCSECGKKARFDGYCYDDKPNYCPNCGAKMDFGV